MFCSLIVACMSVAAFPVFDFCCLHFMVFGSCVCICVLHYACFCKFAFCILGFAFLFYDVFLCRFQSVLYDGVCAVGLLYVCSCIVLVFAILYLHPLFAFVFSVYVDNCVFLVCSF